MYHVQITICNLSSQLPVIKELIHIYFQPSLCGTDNCWTVWWETGRYIPIRLWMSRGSSMYQRNNCDINLSNRRRPYIRYIDTWMCKVRYLIRLAIVVDELIFLICKKQTVGNVCHCKIIINIQIFLLNILFSFRKG